MLIPTREMEMTFYIYSANGGYELSDGDAIVAFATEVDAIDAAIRMAQDANSLYKIFYWAP